MTEMLDAAFLAAVLRVATPLLLAALGVLISERAGVLNIGVEGTMLSAALVAVLVSATAGGPWVGLAAAVAVGGMIGLVMAGLVLRLGTDVIVTGIAVNLAASAGTALLLFLATGDRGMSGTLDSGVLPSVAFAGLPAWLSGHNVMTWFAVAAVPAVWLLVDRSVIGLRLRAVGEYPEAARAAGVSPGACQAIALVLSGAFAGAAGAYLSLGYVSWFGVNMTAGRGFVALAAAVMGDGSAWGAAAAVALIAVAEASAISMGAFGLPSELIRAIPYLAPVVVLVLYALRRRRRAQRST